MLPETLGSERFKIKQEIFRLKRLCQKCSRKNNLKRRISKTEHRIIASIDEKKRRKENIPRFFVDDNLPIAAKKREIIERIRQHQVLIISGDTGSGKTTQIPKLCLEAGRGVEGKIGVTQPRRIAATTVASRIAEELGESLGQSAGYKIRFDEKVSKDCYIKTMTDGILLAETQSDPFLNEYDTLVIDEAHERSLNIDFVLGLLKKLAEKRKNLKIIITSATIDTEKFSAAFDDAPIIEISGRMFPVEVQYWPPEKFGNEEDITHVDMAVEALDQLQKGSARGDILVFMPTEHDIRETCEILEGKKYKGVSVFPLFARLSSHLQKRIFLSAPGRKIIVSTNVAETSITIPGIKYVVDTGVARILKYLPKTRTTTLPVEPISRSSADQRMGRCGRVENGVCIRLYSEEDYYSRPLYTPPEILRSNLAEVILRMIALKLDDIDAFPFIDRPASKSISDGFELLKELGAIREIKQGKKSGNYGYALTEMGRFMAKIPLDPRISRMLIEAQSQGCISDITVIAAALSIQDPRERPLEKAEQADLVQAQFANPTSDFITLVNIYYCYRQIWHHHKSAGKLKHFCKQHYLSYKRMREWQDIFEQLRRILEESGVHVGSHKDHSMDNNKNKTTFEPEYEAVHRSILSGFISNIAQRKEKNTYNAAKGREVMIFPGSGLFKRGGEWIVAAEMIETSRLFARTCANISVRWLESIGKGLCRYSYLSPRWDQKRGEVIAFEQVSLFGLVIVESRPVSYGKINPEEAAEIFIRSALMENNISGSFGFIEHNRGLIDKTIDLENRLRRKDILVDNEELFRFYSSRLSSHVYSRVALKRAVKNAGGDNFLRMEMEDVVNYLPDTDEIVLFPDQIQVGKNSFSCKYHFEPGDQTDGMTMDIPASLAPSVFNQPLDWHVDGFMEEKILCLLKGLPKKYRKKLVPIADTAKFISENIPKENISLLSGLSRFVFDRFGIDIPVSAWSYENLPDHLKIRFSVKDPDGKTICSGRNKEILNKNFSKKLDQEDITQVKKAWERDGIKKWDIGDLPEAITVRVKGGNPWILYPGLKPDEGKTVGLRIFTDRNEAFRYHKEGVVKLFELHFTSELKFIKKDLSMFDIAPEYTAFLGGCKVFEKKLYHSVLKDLFCVNIRSLEAFLSHAESAGKKIDPLSRQKISTASDILKAAFETRQSIFNLEKSNPKNQRFLDFCSQMRNDLEKLIPENFLDLYTNDRLSQLVRFIKVIEIRVHRGLSNPEKDLTKEKILKGFVLQLEEILGSLNPETSEEKKAAVEEFFWLIEEFKVSLFAQELKTMVSVSEKRLSQKMHEIKRMI